MLLRAVDRLSAVVLRGGGYRPNYVRTSVGRTHALVYEGAGPLPPLVLQHGICASAHEYRDVLLGLRPWFRRITAVDMPAHGRSEDPQGGLTIDTLSRGLDETYRILIDEPALFFGNSLGGIAALRYAQHSPHRVRALFLSSPAGARQSDQAFRDFLDSFDMSSHRRARAFVDRLHAYPPWYRWLIAGGVARRFMRPVMQDFVAGLDTDALLTPDELAAIDVPIFLQWGRRDHLMPEEHLDFYRANLPDGAVLEEPDHVGHCPYLDTPEDLVDAIVDWGMSHG